MILLEHDEPVEVTGVGNVTIPTRDSRRAVCFYNRVFGFQVVPEAHSGGTPRVLMRGRGCTCLLVDAHGDATAVPRCLRFETVDLDDARERLWDLGVALTDDCIEPRFDPERRRRWLPLRDPDGNEIELVEQVARRVDDEHCIPRCLPRRACCTLDHHSQ